MHTRLPSGSSCVRESESSSSRSTSKSHSSRPCRDAGQAAEEHLAVRESRKAGARGERLSRDRVARPSALGLGLRVALTGVAGLGEVRL